MNPEPYTPRPDAPSCLIVDIDGTVAIRGNRDPYDMTRVLEDRQNTAIVKVVEALAEKYVIAFVSGRTGDARDKTEYWLGEHMPVSWLTQPSFLYMRAIGDTRNDALVKLDIFNDHIRDDYNVIAVFDDRKRVVDMWRSLGLTVLQVAEGDF